MASDNSKDISKDISALANLKYFQAHAVKYMTSTTSPDSDSRKLNLSLIYQVPYMGQVWYLIVSFSDLCRLYYLEWQLSDSHQKPGLINT